MYPLSRLNVQIFLLAAVLANLCWAENNFSSHILINTDESKMENFYELMLANIQKEKPFETMLLLHQKLEPNDELLQKTFYQYQSKRIAKVIIEKGSGFEYASEFNTEILSVVIMSQELDKELMLTAAETLNYLRQQRIFIVAAIIADQELFKTELLLLCEKYKMTNVLLSFHPSPETSELKRQYYMLGPYPEYHWLSSAMQDNQGVYYPKHWHNFQQKALRTYPDQYAPESLVFKNHQGHLQLSGYIARLVLLFAELYNARLEMYRPLEEGKAVHFTTIAKMVKDELLDLPMSMDAGGRGSWQNMSTTIVVNKVSVMVPMPSQLSISEVYSLLLNWYFFGTVLAFSLLLSVLHSLIDYYFEGIWKILDFLINDKVLPGVLGQTFAFRLTHLMGLRMLYVLLGFVGLNISTQFSANVNSFFTSPPYHGQIEQFSDLQNSPLRILLYSSDAVIMHEFVQDWHSIIAYTNNITQFLESRQNFNTSYGYVVQSAIWDIYNRRQVDFTRKAFHIPLIYIDMMMWGIPLQRNSPYKEALNNLIQYALDSGLIESWKASTYRDMVKLKRVPLTDPNEQRGTKVLTVEDFSCVWLVLAIGWTSSSLVFLMELCFYRGLKRKSLN